MKPGEFFRNEANFQEWLVKNITKYGGHSQSFSGDDRYPGIPDLSIASLGVDTWAEVKLWRKEYYIHTPIKDIMKSTSERQLTAQQRKWLMERADNGSAMCGVLVCWRDHSTRYISFIPIQELGRISEWNLSGLALSRFSDTLDSFLSGKTNIAQFLFSIRTDRGSY